jgi:tetratricopeptide (TPR) repeat protein
MVSPNGVLSYDNSKHCFTARSKCYLQLGDHAAALKDAEQSLLNDPVFIKGLYARAEALYFQGDFEFALVYYHRGNKVGDDDDDDDDEEVDS